jgi:lysozyme
MNEHLALSPEGEFLAHHYEDCKLLAYPDPGSPLFKALQRDGIDPYNLPGGAPQGYTSLSGAPWTIGWGDTGKTVVPGLRITQEEADSRFKRRMAGEFADVIYKNVRVELTQFEFDALSVLIYNIGGENFKESTLLKKLNSGDKPGAADQILLWNRSKKVVLKGLQRRRYAEHLVFRGGDARKAVSDAEDKYP